MISFVTPCALYSHICDVPDAPRMFTTPTEPPGYTWGGRPSVAYGIVRRLAHEERVLSGAPFCRVLYAEGGRQGDPWGSCVLSLSGRFFHFNAGLSRYPALIGEGRIVTEEGNLLLGTGLPGNMTCDTVDWRWVQGESDVTSLLRLEDMSHLMDMYSKYEQGVIPLPLFQSRQWAEYYHVPVSAHSANCTVFHARILEPLVGVSLTEFMPLDLFERLSREVRSLAGAFVRSVSDCKLNQLLHMGEKDLIQCLAMHAPTTTPWKSLAKGEGATPTSLTEWFRG